MADTTEVIREPDPRAPPPRAALAVVLGLAVLAGLIAWLSWKLPLSRALEPLPRPSLVLLDSGGRPFARRGDEKDAPVDPHTLPPYVVRSVLVMEDRQFDRHMGLDFAGIARAMVINLKAGHVVQGGSTITQQLAKQSFLDDERSLRRKVQEALIALWLEARLSKREILSRYLSSVYFGDGVYGLRAAARHYFAKTPETLDLAQAAALAGAISAPSRFNPSRHPDAARARADLVLTELERAHLVSRDAADSARAHPAVILPEDGELSSGGWFADWLGADPAANVRPAYGRTPVRTTLERPLQLLAERTVQQALARAGRIYGARQVGLVAMRTDGSVVAMVGGRDYGSSPFNHATQARRQPGSAFKLFVYLAALRHGFGPDDVVLDAPVNVGDWRPQDFENDYLGPISLAQAFAKSSNTAAVRLSEIVGPGEVVRAARDLGVSSALRDDPSLALGTSEVTLLELTSAYAAVAAGSGPVRPHGIAGAALPAAYSRPLPEQAQLLTLLRAVVAGGTGEAANLSVPVYGKTGTTQDHRDAWFVGFSGDLVTGVWIGNDDGAPMRGVVGGALPAEIFRDFMAGALGARPEPAPGFQFASVGAPGWGAPPPPRHPHRHRHHRFPWPWRWF